MITQEELIRVGIKLLYEAAGWAHDELDGTNLLAGALSDLEESRVILIKSLTEQLRRYRRPGLRQIAAKEKIEFDGNTTVNELVSAIVSKRLPEL